MKLFPILTFGFFAVTSPLAFANPVSGTGTKPKLGVVIVVDQMRGDYPARFGPYFTGGLHRLLTEGAVFDSASHEHANTETAPGHATLSTGCYPSHHGIVGNEFYDEAHDAIVYTVEDTLSRLLRTTLSTFEHDDSLGSSSHYLLRPALGNWLKVNGRGRVFAASLKDRSSILMAGQIVDNRNHPHGVYWWDRKTGDFVTSSRYANALPEWVMSFNRSLQRDSWKGALWDRILDSANHRFYFLIGADRVPQENDGIHTTFPHSLSERYDKKYYDALFASPFGDQLLISFVMEMVREEKVGQTSEQDLLMVSASAADAVGHAFGPNSHEVFDYYLRLDRYLDTLLCQLDTLVGRNNYVVAISSDHGSAELPLGKNRVPETEFRQYVGEAISPQYRWQSIDSVLHIYGTEIAIRRDKLPPTMINFADLVRNKLYNRFLLNPDVAYVLTRRELLDPDTLGFEIEQLAKRGACAGRVPDLSVIFNDRILLTNKPTGTSHGTPWWYDRHVPLVFWGNGIGAQHFLNRVRTVDVAPTMADLMQIDVPDSVDGHSLVSAITK